MFAVYPWMYRQLSLDYFDTEENLKTRWFSGKFWSVFFLWFRSGFMLHSPWTSEIMISSGSVMMIQTTRYQAKKCRASGTKTGVRCNNWLFYPVSRVLWHIPQRVLWRWPVGAQSAFVRSFPNTRQPVSYTPLQTPLFVYIHCLHSSIPVHSIRAKLDLRLFRYPAYFWLLSGCREIKWMK